MQYLLYALGSVILFYLLGLGLALLLLPKDLQRYVPLVAPWIGYSYAAFACWHLYHLGKLITAQTVLYVLIFPLVCLVFAVIKRQFEGVKRVPRPPGGVEALAIIGVIFVVLSIPAFWHARGLTTISIGNNDQAYYGAISRFLCEFGRGSTDGFLGQLPPVASFTVIAEDDHFGAWAFPAFQATFLGVMPHNVLTLCIMMMAAYTGGAAFVVLADTFGLPVRIALFGVILVAAQPIMYYLALDGFLAQIAGMGLALMMFWSGTKLWAAEIDKTFVRNGVTLTVFTVGILLTYQHMLPFIWFFTGVYVGILTFATKQWRHLKWYFVGNIAVIILTVILSPQRSAALFAKVRFAGSVTAGWFMPFLLPNDLAGLFYKHPFLEVVDWRSHAVLSGVAAILIASVVVGFWRKKGYRQLAFAAACIAIYLGALVLAWQGRAEGAFGGYRSFKLLSFFLPFFGVLVAYCFAFKARRLRPVVLGAKAILLVALLDGYYQANKRFMKSPALVEMRVDPEQEALLALDRNSQIDSINLLGEGYWHNMWNIYFLMHKKIYPQSATYYLASDPFGRYDLMDKRSSSGSIVHVTLKESLTAVNLNDRFSLAGPLNRIVSARLGSGWYPGEIGHAWSGQAGKRSTIILSSRAENAAVGLSLVCSALRSNDLLTFQFQGQPCQPEITRDANGTQRIVFPRLTLRRGDNELEIFTQLDPARLGPQDPRLASYLYTTVNMQEL